MPERKFSPVKPLRARAAEFGVSFATFKSRIANDPEFPTDEIVQIGGFGDQPRLGLTDRGAAKYQKILAERARRPHRAPENLGDPRGAAAKSVLVRRAKAQASRVTGSVTLKEAV